MEIVGLEVTFFCIFIKCRSKKLVFKTFSLFNCLIKLYFWLFFSYFIFFIYRKRRNTLGCIPLDFQLTTRIFTY